MVKKLEINQIQTSNISLESFREAVNYQNTKNKGYVRFIPDGKGGVTIGKVNNKLDIFSVNGFRTNTSPEYNKMLRNKLGEAIMQKLTWSSGDSKAAIKRLIKGNDEFGDASTKALSRKDLMEIFKLYDAELNTPAGRTRIMDKVLSDAKRKCGMDNMDNWDFFKANIRPMMSSGLNKMYFRVTETAEGSQNKMALDENVFLGYVNVLKSCCEILTTKTEVERTVRDSLAPEIENFKNNQYTGSIGEFSSRELNVLKSKLLPLAQNMAKADTLLFISNQIDTNENKEEVLIDYLKNGKFNNLPVNTEFDMDVYDVFIEKIIPGMYKSIIENSRDYENKDEYISSQFSVETLVQSLKDFIKGANDFITKETGKNDSPSSQPSQEELAKMSPIERQEHNLGQLGSAVKLLGKNANDAGFANTARQYMQNLGGHTAASKEQLNELADTMAADSKDTFKKALLDIFSKKFLAKNGYLPPEEGITNLNKKNKEIIKSAEKILEEQAKKIATALAIKNGEAQKASDGENRIKNKASVDDILNLIRDKNILWNIVEKNEIEKPNELYEYLSTYMLPNIINQKIQNYGKYNTLDITSNSLESIIKDIKNAVAAYAVIGEKGAQELSAAKKKTFTNMVDSHLKKQNITETQANELKQKADSILNEAGKAAGKEYFLRSPYQNLEEAVNSYRSILNAKMSEAIGLMNSALTMEILSRSATDENAERCRSLLDVRTQIDSYVKARNDSTFAMDNSVVTPGEIRNLLANDILPGLYHKILAEQLSKAKADKLPENLETDVKNKFYKEADKLVKTYMDNGRKFIGAFRTRISEHMAALMEDGGSSLLNKYAACTKEQKKHIENTLISGIMSRQAGNIRNVLLTNMQQLSSQIEQKDLDFHVEALFNNNTGDNTVYGNFTAICTEYENAVTEMCNDRTLPGDLHKKLTDMKEQNSLFPAGVSLNERIKLYDQVLNQIISEEVSKYPMAFPAQKDKFDEAVHEMCTKLLGKIKKEYGKFREEFMKNAPAQEKDIDLSLLGKNFGQVREYVLTEAIAAMKDMHNLKLDAKSAIETYRELLIGYQGDIVDKQIAEMAKLQEKISIAHTYFMDKVETELKNVENMLDTCKVSEKVKEYFKSSIVPKIKEYYNVEINTDPDKYSKDYKDSADRDRALTDSITNCFSQIFTFNSLHDDNGISNLLDMIGKDDICKDNRNIDQAKALLKDWAAKKETAELIDNANIAILDYCLENRLSFKIPEAADAGKYNAGFIPEEQNGPVAKLRSEAREQIKNIAAQHLFSTDGVLNNDTVELAKQQFESWLDSYLQTRQGTTSKTMEQVREKLIDMFNSRVAWLLQESVNNDNKLTEPILSSEFIRKIDTTMDEEVTLAVFKEIREEKAKQCFDFLSTAFCFKLKGSRGEELSYSENVKKVIEFNREHLMSVINAELMAIQLELDSNDDHSYVMETLEINRGKLEKKFEETFEKLSQQESESIKEVIQVATDRFNFEVAVDKACSSSRDELENGLIDFIRNSNAKKFFGSIKTRDTEIKNMVDIAARFPENTELYSAINTIQTDFYTNLMALIDRGRNDNWDDATLQNELKLFIDKFSEATKKSGNFAIIFKALSDLDSKAGKKQ